MGALLIGALGCFSAHPAGATVGTTRLVPAQYPTIQAAITASTTGDIVRVAPGHYMETLDFGGKNITLVSVGGSSQTTIDGSAATNAFHTTVTIGPLGIIRGFTITGGTFSFGGGMLVNGAGSVVTDNVFTGNSDPDGGGYGA